MAAKRKLYKIEIKCFTICADDGFISDESKLTNWNPPDIYNFATHVEMSIGEKGNKGADYFTAFFATAGMVSEIPNEKRKKMIIIPYWNWDFIIAEINAIVYAQKFYSWSEFCDYIVKYFYWEYENYREP